MNGVILIDPDESAVLRLKAAISWKEVGISFLGVCPGLSECPPPGTQEPLLVIAEIPLPGMALVEVFKTLSGCFPAALLAIMTSDRHRAPAREAFRYGVIRYLQKPFST